jgi:hypothetical protein
MRAAILKSVIIASEVSDEDMVLLGVATIYNVNLFIPFIILALS